jgi:ABC-type uncharacterized transport system substrate-binding protein
MKRRAFVTGIFASIAAWPGLSRADQPLPILGFLGFTSPEAFAREIAAFKRGLGEAGYVDGHNVVIEYRWAHGQFDRLNPLAAELVRRGVNVIAATGTPASALAAKAATSDISIVFTTGADPVQLGLVDSLNRPNTNATGVYMLTTALEGKRLELLHEVVPSATVIGVMVDPNSPDTTLQLRDLPVAARSLGQRIEILKAGNDSEIDAALATMVGQRMEAMLVASSPYYLPRLKKIVDFAERHNMPAIYFFRAFAEVGGLMSYGTDLVEAYRQTGFLAGRMLKGERPANLPVQQSTKVELIINLKTAKRLGVTIPIPLLGRADEIIE